MSLISLRVSSETFSLSSLFDDFSVDISILSDFANEEPSEGDDTLEAAITLELLAIDELFETEKEIYYLNGMKKCKSSRLGINDNISKYFLDIIHLTLKEVKLNT